MTNTPPYIASDVTDTGTGANGEKRRVMTTIGAAWAEQEGKGVSVQSDGLPIEGRRMPHEPLPDGEGAGATCRHTPIQTAS